MKKNVINPSRGRTKGVVVGTVAAGVALTAAFALTGVTPSSAFEAVLATTTTPGGEQPAESPAPQASKGPGAAAKPEAAAVKAPKVSDAVGVAPAKPKANDQELGRTPQNKNKPVKLTDKVQVLDGMTIAVAKVVAVQGVADEPGEVAGDAVMVSVTLTNTSGTPADTSGVIVDLEALPDMTPGIALSGTGSSIFPASIEPGASSTADYVFVLDNAKRTRVSISVNYSVTAPIATFEGTAPSAKGKK
jgi:hypothetical protein